MTVNKVNIVATTVSTATGFFSAGNPAGRVAIIDFYNIKYHT